MDPSPWADERDEWSEEPDLTTTEQLRQATDDRIADEAAAFWDRHLWERYARKTRADGGVIR